MRMHRGIMHKYKSTITGISYSRVLGFLNPIEGGKPRKNEQRTIEMQKVKQARQLSSIRINK